MDRVLAGILLRQHIGAGSATRAASLEISWPTSPTVQKFSDTALDQFYQLREGNLKLTLVQQEALTYKHLPEVKHQGSM